MTVNTALVEKTARGLISDSEERQAFVHALLQGNSSERAILWLRDQPAECPFKIAGRASWQPAFVDWLGASEQPGSTSQHARGDFYCLDLSSVFAASVLVGLLDRIPAPTVLDMCAAPGGKGIFAWRTLLPKVLLANEVIGKRIPALISNLGRCKIHPAAVVRHDPSFFAKAAPSMFDLVIVDAPCSGQSLVAKGDDSPGCFHPSTINMNSNRQKRIIANAAAAVAPGGYLAYMTCTYSEQENEAVVKWLLKKFPSFKPLEAPLLQKQQSSLADFPCYRLWPQLGEGAGAFTALLQNQAEGQPTPFDEGIFHSQWRS